MIYLIKSEHFYLSPQVHGIQVKYPRPITKFNQDKKPILKTARVRSILTAHSRYTSRQ